MLQKQVGERFAVLIPDGESWLAHSVLSCLGQIESIDVFVLAQGQFSPSRFSRHVRRFFYHSSEQTKLVAIDQILATVPIDIILPIDTETIRLLASHQSALGKTVALAPLPNLAAMDIAADKGNLAIWLQAHNIAGPTTLIYQADTAFEQQLRALPFPVLLKPAQQVGDDIGVGGRGIQPFDTPDALLAFCQQTPTISYIVQPVIAGYDLGCNVLCQNGQILACTIQKGFRAGRRAFQPASGVDFIDEQSVRQFIAQIVAKLAWSGVANFDLRYDTQQQQLKLLEINSRFWGSLLGSLCAGVNFPYLACCVGLGLLAPAVTVRPLRYVDTGAALALLASRLMGRGYDASALGFVLADPLPKLVAYSQKQFKKKFAINV
jgi:predicted ATP-grasp superfamily ATP-dependent carboligase